MHNIPAVIFAGGKSSRMGSDKALLPFRNFSTLSAFQHHKLSLLFSDVYLSSKTNKFDFTCNVITDNYEESSPLVGIISLFETLDVDEIFVLSVDAPLVDKEVIEKLFLACEESTSDAIIAKSPNGIQPLCGIYRRSILPLATRQLTLDNHRLTDLLNAAKLTSVVFNTDVPFTNLNTQAQYQKLFLD